MEHPGADDKPVRGSARLEVARRPVVFIDNTTLERRAIFGALLRMSPVLQAMPAFNWAGMGRVRYALFKRRSAWAYEMQDYFSIRILNHHPLYTSPTDIYDMCEVILSSYDDSPE